VLTGGGRSTLWLRAPLVATDGSAYVWLYFDRRDASPPTPDAAGVWSGYEGAWHFTGDLNDVSGNGQDAADFGTTDFAGVTGRARRFGNNNYLRLGGTFGSVAGFSLSLWFRAGTTGDTQMLWHIGQAGNTGDGYGGTDEIHMHLISNSTRVQAHLEASSNDIGIDANANAGSASWHHAMLTWDGTTARLYVDALEVESATGTPDVFSFDEHHLGRPQYNTRMIPDGELDEPRYTNATRTRADAQVEWRSVRDELITLGAVERIP
jgi:hypothetical protein